METNRERLWSLGNNLGFRAEGPGGWASPGMGIKEARVVLNRGVLHTANRGTYTKTDDVLYGDSHNKQRR